MSLTEPSPLAHSIVPIQFARQGLAAGYKVFSFDVFDTLLWRGCLWPQDLFRTLAGGDSTLVAKLRVAAEITASVLTRRALGREPRLSDFYHALPFPATRELALEREFCRPNPGALKAVRELQAADCTVFAISDMYLDSESIQMLLTTAGYPALAVFSSADQNATKSDNGQLFEVVLNQLGQTVNEVLHYGDNPHADVAMAHRRGITAWQAPTPRDTLFALWPHARQRPDSLAASKGWGELACLLRSRLDLAGEIDPAACSPLRQALHGFVAPPPLSDRMAWARLGETIDHALALTSAVKP